jgi:hypothetical protein
MVSRSIIDEVRSAYPGYGVQVTRRVAAILYSDWAVSQQEIEFLDWCRRSHGYVTAVFRLAISLEELG